MSNPASKMRKALVYTVDEQDRAVALFSAWKVATTARPRDFDILICSFSPLAIPDHLSALGIRNVVFDLQDTVERENLPLLWLPAITYLRLWLPDALRLQYDRILYLDADTYLVSPELSRLFEVDLGGHVLAAVLDKMQWQYPDRPILDFEAQGLDIPRYFNAGVCLFDVAGYNARNLLDEMLAINRAGTLLMHHDQSLLNLATKGNWAELSPRWNWQWTHRFPGFTEDAAPLLHHFGGAPKPWTAHRQPTNFPGDLVEEYAAFFSGLDTTHRFETNHYGGLRPSLPRKIEGVADSLLMYRRYQKLLKRHGNAFETRC